MQKLNCAFKILPHSAEGHCHSYAHIIIPCENPVWVCFEQTEYLVDNSHMIYIPGGIFHQFSSNGAAMVFDIPHYMIKQSDLNTLKQNCLLEMSYQLKLIVKLIGYELTHRGINNSLCYLYYYVYDQFVEHELCLSMRYIEENYNENISITKLAKLENYNVCYFSEWFRRKSGCTPREYLQTVRIDKAKELLITTDYSITEIAMQVGYCSSSSFARSFKLITGLSPSEFRANLRE